MADITQPIGGTPEQVAERFLADFRAAIPAGVESQVTIGADGSETIEFTSSPLPRMVAHHRLRMEPPAGDGSRTVRFDELIEGRGPLAGRWRGHTTFAPDGAATVATTVVEETTFGAIIRRMGESKLRSGMRSLARSFATADVDRGLAG